MTVKEVDINSKVLYINWFVLIIASCYTRFRTTRFYTTSKAVGKGIIVYRYNYILSSFN
jgi:hypothetical protein